MVKWVLLYVILLEVLLMMLSEDFTVSFLGTYKELSAAGMCDAAEEGSFKKAEKVTAPSDALRLSKTWVSALG